MSSENFKQNCKEFQQNLQIDWRVNFRALNSIVIKILAEMVWNAWLHLTYANFSVYMELETQVLWYQMHKRKKSWIYFPMINLYGWRAAITFKKWNKVGSALIWDSLPIQIQNRHQKQILSLDFRDASKQALPIRPIKAALAAPLS